MGRVEVLVATMGQTNFSKYAEMNLCTDVVFANQCDCYGYEEKMIEGHRIRMFSTPERGVGKNRNIALAHVEREILLFADDDMIYQDDYEEKILKAFDELPQADLILFEGDIYQEGVCVEKMRHSLCRLRPYNLMRYPTWLIAGKKESIKKARLLFSEYFGGGAIYGSGEDSLFLLDAYRKGLKIYSYPYMLGKNIRDFSTWFSGYHEKYYYDKGAWTRMAFPGMFGMIFMLYIVWRIRHMTELSVKECMRNMWSGWKNSNLLIAWSESKSE